MLYIVRNITITLINFGSLSYTLCKFGRWPILYTFIGQKNSANHDTSLNDLSSSTQSSGRETSMNNFSLTESRTKILAAEVKLISLQEYGLIINPKCIVST